MNSEQQTTSTAERVHVHHDRCPFCHDPVVAGGDLTACTGCLAWHHQDCWGEHGGCSACGHGVAIRTRSATEGKDLETGPVPRVCAAPECGRPLAIRVLGLPTTHCPMHSLSWRIWIYATALFALGAGIVLGDPGDGLALFIGGLTALLSGLLFATGLLIRDDGRRLVS